MFSVNLDSPQEPSHSFMWELVGSLKRSTFIAVWIEPTMGHNSEDGTGFIAGGGRQWKRERDMHNEKVTLQRNKTGPHAGFYSRNVLLIRTIVTLFLWMCAYSPPKQWLYCSKYFIGAAEFILIHIRLSQIPSSFNDCLSLKRPDIVLILIFCLKMRIFQPL